MSTLDSLFLVPTPINEPVRNYAPGDASRSSLKARLKSMGSEKIEIPLLIGGREVRTGNKRRVVMPHSHREVVAEFQFHGCNAYTEDNSQ